MQAVGIPSRDVGNSGGDRQRESWHIPIRYFVMFGLVVSALSVAWGFAGIEGELQARDRGTAFNDADLALDAASNSRSHLGEALRGAAYSENVADADLARVVDLALSLAGRELVEFDLRSDVVLAREADPALTAVAERYLDAGGAVVAALAAGDVGTADAVFISNLDPAYTELSTSLTTIRAANLASFTNSSGITYAISLATRFLLAVVVPLAAIIVIFDAMRRRQRQRELQLELEAEREFVNTKDEFIANVSHELRTPLTIVAGFATVLEDDEDLPAHARDAASYISRESGELTRMVEDLLTAARADAGALAIKPEQFPIHKAIEAVVEATDHGDGRITYTLESAVAYADAFRVRQIVRNLLSNALKHGGPEIHVSGVVESEQYVVTVADNGDGVSPEIQDKVFERFVHGSNDRLLAGSVGLGLAIVKSLSERMGIDVTFQRLSGETQFILRVPLLPAGHDLRLGNVIHLDVVESV